MEGSSKSDGRRRKTRLVRGLVVLVGLSGASAAIVAASACLPDLATIASGDGAVDASLVPFQGCGDGIIATLDDGGDAGESCDPGGDAQVPGCRACQITCEGTLDPTTGHCYFAAGVDTSYAEARARCRAARAHVVTLVSTDEAKVVEQVAANESGYWLGLARKDVDLSGAYGPPVERPEEPGFPYPNASLSSARGPCAGCFGIGVDADGGLFPRDVDASDTTTETSCLASRNGTWLQVPCSGTTTRPTVCEREPVGVRGQVCGNDGICLTLARTAGVKTYLVTVSKADPDTAASTCRFLDGGSLVILESREEREQLAHEILARFANEGVPPQLWIGLSADGGTWTWDDGVPATADASRPLPWGNAQPNGAANARAFIRIATGSYDTELAAADDGTGAPSYFICQRPAQ